MRVLVDLDRCQASFDRAQGPRLISAPPCRLGPLLRGPSALAVTWKAVLPWRSA